jgi:hypothetical protein
VGLAFSKRAFLANPSLSVSIVKHLVCPARYGLSLHAIRAKPRIL